MSNIIKNEDRINPLHYDYIRRNNGIHNVESYVNLTDSEIKRRSLIISLKIEVHNFKIDFEKKLNIKTTSIVQKLNRVQLKNARKKYRGKVDALTKKQALHTLENIERRSFKDWHVDHIVSVSDGFKYNIPVEIISDISNLRVISRDANYEKGGKSDYFLLNNMLIPVVAKHLIEIIWLQRKIKLSLF